MSPIDPTPDLELPDESTTVPSTVPSAEQVAAAVAPQPEDAARERALRAGLEEYELEDEDLQLLEGTFIVFSAAVIVCNLLADLLYRALDPRVRRQ